MMASSFLCGSLLPLLAATDPVTFALWIAGACLLVFLLSASVGARYIPNNRVGVIEKLWSGRGSVTEGRILALNREVGYQADLLRGGMHFGFWRWQYRIHNTTRATASRCRRARRWAASRPAITSRMRGRSTANRAGSRPVRSASAVVSA